MKYEYNNNGKIEEVILERWMWAVKYQDGTMLEQFEIQKDKGIFHRFAEIKQSEVKVFAMISAKRQIVIAPDGSQIFHFYRNYVFGAGTPNERREKVYVFGYKDGSGAHYHYILPDDNVIISNKDLQNIIN